LGEKNELESSKNKECDGKLEELEEDMNDKHDRDIRDLNRSLTDQNAASAIKMNHSWNIKCKKEKDEVASEHIEKCLGQT